MIKLKDILMENYFSIYYWMDPDGEFHKVDNESHAPWANEYLQTHNLPIIAGKPYESMYKLGWVRVGIVGHQGQKYLAYNYSRVFGLANSAFRNLKDAAIEKNCDVLRDDTAGKTIELDGDRALAESAEILNERMSYEELLDASEKGRKKRASHVRARSIPVTAENGKESWNFRYKSNPSTTGKPWQGYIQFFKEIEDKNNEDAMDLDCHADCSCPDFTYRWAYADARQDASVIGSKSLNKCINRPPDYMNPKQKPGLCKHLIALTDYLKTKIHGGSKQNIFESLNEITRIPNHNITVYD
jgi:hypothetical protein